MLMSINSIIYNEIPFNNVVHYLVMKIGGNEGGKMKANQNSPTIFNLGSTSIFHNFHRLNHLFLARNREMKSFEFRDIYQIFVFG